MAALLGSADLELSRSELQRISSMIKRARAKAERT